MKRILFIPSTMQGGVYYFRCYTPLKMLSEEFDITIDNHYTFTPSEIDEIGKNYSIVWVHNGLFQGEIQDKFWTFIIYCKREYGSIYKDIDVLLIPLCNNKFNRCKNELKLIEAGFTNTAFICSDVIPYNNFSKANLGFNFIKNPNPQEWAKSIKKIIRNPELIEEIKTKNREQILQSRTLEEINKLRYEFLKQII